MSLSSLSYLIKLGMWFLTRSFVCKARVTHPQAAVKSAANIKLNFSGNVPRNVCLTTQLFVPIIDGLCDLDILHVYIEMYLHAEVLEKIVILLC